MSLLGLVGRKGSGKDTVGDYLVARHGFVRAAFADPVKWVARDLWPHLTVEQCWGPIAVKEAVDTTLGVSPRWLLQRIGTEVGRNGDLATFAGLGVSPARMQEALDRHGVVPGPSAWVDALFRALGAVDTVITDVRFPNEAEAVRDHNGWVLKILRPGFDTGVGNDHPSEREVDACAFDYLVRNDRDVPELHAKVRRILDDVRYAATR
jgi:hypothetical protein